MQMTAKNNQRQSGRAGTVVLVLIIAFFAWQIYRTRQINREAKERAAAAERFVGAVLDGALDATLNSRSSQPQPSQGLGKTPQYGSPTTRQEQSTRSTTHIYDGVGRETGRIQYDSKTGQGIIYDNTTSNPNDEILGRRFQTTPH